MADEQTTVAPSETPEQTGENTQPTEQPNENEGKTVEQIENPEASEETLPETLLQKFLNGEEIKAHKPIHLEIAPMTVKSVEGGGVIVTPSSQIIVKYKDQ